MDQELRKLTNNLVSSSKECKPRSKSRKVIEDLENLIRHIDKKYYADQIEKEDLAFLKLTLISLVRMRLTFAETYDQASFDEEVERLDDRIETHELAYEIHETLDETLRLENGYRNNY